MLLLIPGPVTTDARVRAAMAQDFAPWDADFAPIYDDVRARLHAVAGGLPEGAPGGHSVLALQGSGHFALEAALRSFIPRGGSLLVPMTGQYAERAARLAVAAGRVVHPLPVAADQRIEPHAVARALADDPGLGHVLFVYSETSTGIVHDAQAVGAAVRAAGRRVLLDAVSAFGALPLNLAEQPEIDAAVFTSNKCLEGLPGLSFVALRGDRVLACAGTADSWSLDLADIYRHVVDHRAGFRFTPPAQVLAALRVALDLFDAEGGRAARLARYTANMRALYDGLRGIGLAPYLPRDLQGPIVLNVRAPDDPDWDLHRFVAALKARGVLISNFHNTARPSFRIGCIGHVTPDDMRATLPKLRDAMDDIGVRLDRAA